MSSQRAVSLQRCSPQRFLSFISSPARLPSPPVTPGRLVLVPPAVVGCDSCHVCCDRVTVALGQVQGLTEEDSGVCKLISLLLWLLSGTWASVTVGRCWLTEEPRSPC